MNKLNKQLTLTSVKRIKQILKQSPCSLVPLVVGIKKQWYVTLVEEFTGGSRNGLTHYIISSTRNPYEPKKHATVTSAVNLTRRFGFTQTEILILKDITQFLSLGLTIESQETPKPIEDME
jgi:hypothetical protein